MNLGRLHNGFVLAEVVIALAVIGSMLTGLLALQATVFRRVTINTNRINRFYPLKNCFINAFKEPLAKDQKIRESQDEQLNVRITYEQLPIKEKSKLARFQGLYQKKVTGFWHDQNKERLQEVISYGFRPPEKEK